MQMSVRPPSSWEPQEALGCIGRFDDPDFPIALPGNGTLQFASGKPAIGEEVSLTRATRTS